MLLTHVNVLFDFSMGCKLATIILAHESPLIVPRKCVCVCVCVFMCIGGYDLSNMDAKKPVSTLNH